MPTAFNPDRLSACARRLRGNVIRMIARGGSGHPGGSLSAIDLITYLYFHRMRIDPANPSWPDRDRFVLSKGHCAPALYAALAERGFFPEDVLWTLRDLGSALQGHPDMNKTPGVDVTSGSLGQGFSCAVGMALAGRLDGRDYRVFAMLGDSEMQCGMIWEAATLAAHHRLANLIAIVDNNRLQSDGVTAEIVQIEPLEDKWRAFGWDVQRIDGHVFDSINAAFERTAAVHDRPQVIVADTVKGKGVSFMEQVVNWHSGAPNAQQTEAALRELSLEVVHG